MIYNYRNSINVDKSKYKEIQNFITRVERFVKNILPKMGNEVKAFLDVSELVGQGVTATLYIYGYRDMYADEYEFGRVNNEKDMRAQVGSIVKSTIGPYSLISASTYWNSKKKLGNKTLEIGPYVCVEFSGDAIYESVIESKSARLYANDAFDKLSYAFEEQFGIDLKKLSDEGKVITKLGLRVANDNTKALAFVKDYNFKRVPSVGAHSQDKPSDSETDFLLDNKEDIADCLNYLVSKANLKRTISFVNESSRKIIEAKEPLLSKEDEKTLEKTLLKIFAG